MAEDDVSELACPDCGAPMVLRKGPFNKFYGCSRYPLCRGSHSAHQKTGEPLGIPANAETRGWRIEAHAVFDTLWRGSRRKMTRPAAYQWLMLRMNLPVEEAHIGRFTLEQCKKLIKLVEEEDPDERGAGASGELLRQVNELATRRTRR